MSTCFRVKGDVLMKDNHLISVSKSDSKVEIGSSMSFKLDDAMPPESKDEDELSCPVPSKRNSLYDMSTALAYADDDQGPML